MADNRIREAASLLQREGYGAEARILYAVIEKQEADERLQMRIDEELRDAGIEPTAPIYPRYRGWR
jgi:hypothetical protein